MTLFAAEVRRRLSAETTVNEDHGLIAYGFAVLGWPLEEPWVKVRDILTYGGKAVGTYVLWVWEWVM